jgi:DNA polymerase elongation subunit (family B)
VRSRKVKRLFLDIETSPNVVSSWRVGHRISLSVENIIQERAIICVGYRWEGEKVKCLTWDRGDDVNLVRRVVRLIDAAEEVVAHNGRRFDIPWIRARAAIHDIFMLPPVSVFDTMDALKGLYLNSRKLAYMGQLGLTKAKLSTSHQLWKDVVIGSEPALKKMVAYCKNDVDALVRLYRKLIPHVLRTSKIARAPGACPQCTGIARVQQVVRAAPSGRKRYLVRCATCMAPFITAKATMGGTHE